MKLLLTGALTFFVLGLNAQITLIDEDFTSGIPASWTVVDVDGNIPNNSVSQFTSAWIGFTTVFDTCAASTSYYENPASSEDYLITPQLNLLGGGNMLSWDAKSFDATFPDSYIVLISTTDTNPNSFTDTIVMIENESPYWTSYVYDLFDFGYANQGVYVAFKNVSTDAYILGIDNVKITTNDPLSVSKVKQSVLVKVYPNPTTSFLNIVTDNFLKAQLFNISGQKVIETNKHVINVIDLPKGIYILRVTAIEGIIEKKIVIN
ncbi:MAG TPA: T9SS type A sorting domain-containing protein [Crocinitomix sp.]|nr:T9SS type A sorting domain-containing protein [Crocinitomix sp.]